MINVELALELRNAQKKFWANWKQINAATAELNAANDATYSWQYYAGLEGVGNPAIFPEVTNYQIAQYVIEGVEPSEDINYILNY